MNEIEAGLGFLIATVAIGCAGIIETIKKAAADKNPEKRTWVDPLPGCIEEPVNPQNSNVASDRQVHPTQ